MKAIEQMRPDLVVQVLELRREGASFEACAAFISKETRVDVGRELFRTWFAERQKESPSEPSQEAVNL